MNKKILKLLLIVILPLTLSAANEKGGTVKGKIISGKTGDAIPGVVVEITGTSKASITDSLGIYTINNVEVGYKTLNASFLGYKTHHSESFLISIASPVVQDISLEEDPLSLEEVVIRTPRFISIDESPLSARRIGIEEIEKTPGATRDISRAIQAMPGVISTSVQRNDLLVRGGGANENRYFLDGIEIPVLNHFAIQGGSGGNASLVNTDFLSGVNFFSSAFPSYFSNGLSSVVDMRTRVGNSERLKVKATLGASDFGISLDTPVSKKGNTTLLASYRHSYLQMLFKVLGLPFLPTYNDAQFKLYSKIDDKNDISIIGLGSFDKNVLNKTLKDPSDYQRYLLGYIPSNDQNSYTIGINYHRKIKSGSVNVILSRNHFSNIFEKYINNDVAQEKILDYDSREADNRFKVSIKKSFEGGYNFAAGIGGGIGEYKNNTMRYVFIEEEKIKQDYSSSLSLFRYEFFASLSKNFISERLNTTLSIRSDANTYNIGIQRQ